MDDDEFVRWHRHRPWVDGFQARPYRVVNPCGDCGKGEAEHPIPSLRRGEAVAREFLRMREALQQYAASGGVSDG